MLHRQGQRPPPQGLRPTGQSETTPTNILELDGKALQRELDKIAAENPSTYRFWTDKEIQVVKTLKAKGVPARVIAKVVGRSTAAVRNRLYEG